MIRKFCSMARLTHLTSKVNIFRSDKTFTSSSSSITKEAIFTDEHVELRRSLNKIIEKDINTMAFELKNKTCQVENITFFITTQERVPFEVCEVVTWLQFTLALNMRWTMANGHPLNDNHLDYLASKLYGGVYIFLNFALFYPTPVNIRHKHASKDQYLYVMYSKRYIRPLWLFFAN